MEIKQEELLTYLSSLENHMNVLISPRQSLNRTFITQAQVIPQKTLTSPRVKISFAQTKLKELYEIGQNVMSKHADVMCNLARKKQLIEKIIKIDHENIQTQNENEEKEREQDNILLNQLISKEQQLLDQKREIQSKIGEVFKDNRALEDDIENLCSQIKVLDLEAKRENELNKKNESMTLKRRNSNNKSISDTSQDHIMVHFNKSLQQLFKVVKEKEAFLMKLENEQKSLDQKLNNLSTMNRELKTQIEQMKELNVSISWENSGMIEDIQKYEKEAQIQENQLNSSMVEKMILQKSLEFASMAQEKIQAKKKNMNNLNFEDFQRSYQFSNRILTAEPSTDLGDIQRSDRFIDEARNFQEISEIRNPAYPIAKGLFQRQKLSFSQQESFRYLISDITVQRKTQHHHSHRPSQMDFSISMIEQNENQTLVEEDYEKNSNYSSELSSQQNVNSICLLSELQANNLDCSQFFLESNNNNNNQGRETYGGSVFETQLNSHRNSVHENTTINTPTSDFVKLDFKQKPNILQISFSQDEILLSSPTGVKNNQPQQQKTFSTCSSSPSTKRFSFMNKFQEKSKEKLNLPLIKANRAYTSIFGGLAIFNNLPQFGQNYF